MFRCRRLILLGVITLFLLPGAARGQSRPPTSPGPDRHLQADKEDVKPSLEDPREPPLKDLREQPVLTQEDRAGRPLKDKQVIKPKGTVSRFKKPEAAKPTSGSNQDWPDSRAESHWWPSNPQPVRPSKPLSPLELSLKQYLKEDSTPEEDEADDRGEEIKNLPEELQKLIKGEEIKNLPEELQKLIKSKVGPQDTMLEED